jgi:hypothetical protein
MTTLTLSLERHQLGHGSDMDCLIESFKILDLERQKKMDGIMEVNNARHRKELENMLNMFVSEIKSLLHVDYRDGMEDWLVEAKERMQAQASADAAGQH